MGGLSQLTLNCFMGFLAASYETEGLMSCALHPRCQDEMSADKGKVPEQLGKNESCAE
jgi:hypothetical protein